MPKLPMSGRGNLILTRRPGQSIVLETSDGPVVITYREPKGNNASLGVEAPRGVTIWRSELVAPARRTIVDSESSGTDRAA